MKKPLDYYSLYVIDTYITLTFHWPIFKPSNIAAFLEGVQLFFLTPKLRTKKNNDVWFLKTPVGKNPLNQTVKQLMLKKLSFCIASQIVGELKALAEENYLGIEDRSTFDELTGGKYHIHLNISSLLGYYFNSGYGSNFSTFPLEKKDQVSSFALLFVLFCLNALFLFDI
jgi:hypothetical protein